MFERESDGIMRQTTLVVHGRLARGITRLYLTPLIKVLVREGPALGDVRREHVVP